MLPIFVINRDEDTQRLTKLSAALAAFGLAWERIAAVAGESIAKSVLDTDNRRALQRTLSPAEMGCLHSHVALWRRIAQGADMAALVLEDDVILADSLPKLLADISWLPSDDCIVRLEAFPMKVVLGDAMFMHGIGSLHPIRSVCYGSAAYIITKKRALAMLDRYQELVDGVDVLMFRYPCGQPVYQYVPAPCVQEFVYLGQKNDSVIETQRRRALRASWHNPGVILRRMRWRVGSTLKILRDRLCGYALTIVPFG